MVEIDDGSIGPHEGRELELMLSGSKPLSVFVIENPDPDWTEFPEEQFDEQVALGNLLKIERVKQVAVPAGGVINIRTVYYSLPKEEWRIHAFFLEVCGQKARDLLISVPDLEGIRYLLSLL